MQTPFDPVLAARFEDTVDAGLGAQNRAFPFIYTLVPRDADTWDTVKAASPQGNLVDLGPYVPSGAIVRRAVIFQPDYNFKLLRIAYKVFKVLDTQGFFSYYWYDPAQVVFNDIADYQTILASPLLEYLNVNVWFTNDTRTLYGVTNQDLARQTTVIGPIGVQPLPSGMIPLNPQSCQGYDYKPNSGRTEYLLPKNGGLLFEFQNISDYNFVVTAAIIGLKVRI